MSISDGVSDVKHLTEYSNETEVMELLFNALLELADPRMEVIVSPDKMSYIHVDDVKKIIKRKN